MGGEGDGLGSLLAFSVARLDRIFFIFLRTLPVLPTRPQSMNMAARRSVCVCLCMRLCVCVCPCVSTYVLVFAYVCVSASVCVIFIGVHTLYVSHLCCDDVQCTCMCIFSCVQDGLHDIGCLSRYTCTHTHAHTHSPYTHIHIYIPCIHTCTHTFTHVQGIHCRCITK